MAFYLELLFEAHLDGALKPKQEDGGRVDLFDLGLIQNVSTGQALARIHEDAGDGHGLRPELRLTDRAAAIGSGVAPSPGDPDLLLATASGHVSFQGGRIEVKKVVRIDGDVGPRTGNIFFIGDFQAKGTVRSGYMLEAKNIRVGEAEPGCQIIAKESLFIEGGVIGSPKTVIEAGVNMRLGFCENAILIARGNLLVDKSCVNCKIYAGPHLAVRGTLSGRKAYVQQKVFAGERLGSKMGVTTQIILGFDPHLLVRAKLTELAIRQVREQYDQLRREIGPAEDPETPQGRELASVNKKLDRFIRRKRSLWDKIAATSLDCEKDGCVVIAPGDIYPGVEISIGPAHLAIDEPMRNVRFSLKDGEISVTSPAV